METKRMLKKSLMNKQHGKRIKRTRGCWFKNTLPFNTDFLSQWIDTYKKQTYSNGRPKENCRIKKDYQKETALKILHTYYMLSNDGDNTNSINKGGYLLFANKLATVPRERERMLQRNKRNRRATNIDQFLKESKVRRKYLAMAWRDYKREFDMVLQSWIADCKARQFIKKTMGNWRVQMSVRRKSFIEVKIKRGLLQGDSLSPLLFVITMMLRNNIRRKGTDGDKLHKSREKSNMDGIKLLSKEEKNWKPKY